MAQMNPQQMHMMQMQQQQQQQMQMQQQQSMNPQQMHMIQMQQQQQQQQQMQIQQQQQQQQAQRQSQEDKLVSKARELINGPLREKWNLTLKEASQKLYANGILDSGGHLANANAQGAKFESHLEDFYATCDQIEVVLKCAIESQKLAQASTRYMLIQPAPSKLECTAQNPEEFLSYPQYISVAKQQIQYANNIREMIKQATTDVVEQRHSVPPSQQPQQQQQMGQQQQTGQQQQQMGQQQQQQMGQQQQMTQQQPQQQSNIGMQQMNQSTPMGQQMGYQQ